MSLPSPNNEPSLTDPLDPCPKQDAILADNDPQDTPLRATRTIYPRSRAPIQRYLVTQTSDDKLVVSAQRGSELSFNTLIYRHRTDAYQLAYHILYKPNGRIDARQSADDVLQEACLRAWKFIKSCRPEQFRAWFRAIVRNECKRLFQNLAKDFKNLDQYTDIESIEDYGNWMIADEEVALKSLTAEDGLSETERAMYLEVIESLSPKQKSVYNLSRSGMTNIEIGAKLNLSPNAVGYHKHVAIKNVKKGLKHRLEIKKKTVLMKKRKK